MEILQKERSATRGVKFSSLSGLISRHCFTQIIGVGRGGGGKGGGQGGGGRGGGG